MKEFTVNHIMVIFKDFDKEDQITDTMAHAAVDYAEEHKDLKIAVINKIIITKTADNTIFDVEYKDEDQPKISRIRRITGYLTGSIDRWNNAKRCELKDRINHI